MRPCRLRLSKGTVAVFTFPQLADGNYRLQIPNTAARDAFGNGLALDYTWEGLDAFIFAGDANRDRIVNIGDFAILASKFHSLGTFSQGDFNYSSVIEISDFAILASRFNSSIPAPSDVPRRGPTPFESRHKSIFANERSIWERLWS